MKRQSGWAIAFVLAFAGGLVGAGMQSLPEARAQDGSGEDGRYALAIEDASSAKSSSVRKVIVVLDTRTGTTTATTWSWTGFG